MEQKKRDLETLHEEVKTMKLKSWDYLHQLTTLSPSDIRHHGYSSIEEGVVKSIKKTVAEIENKIQAFEKKYPD